MVNNQIKTKRFFKRLYICENKKKSNDFTNNHGSIIINKIKIELEKVKDTNRYNIKYADGFGSGIKIDSSQDTEKDEFIAIKYKDKLINFTNDKLEI